MIMLLQILIKTVDKDDSFFYIFSQQKQNDGFIKQRNCFFFIRIGPEKVSYKNVVTRTTT